MDAKAILNMKQERATLTNDIREIMNKFPDGNIPADKNEEITRMEARFDDLNAKIITEEKQLERERIAGEKAEPPKEQRSEVRELFAKALGGETQHVNEYRNAVPTLGSDGQAGYLTAPVEFVQELIKGLNDILFMRQISRVVGPIGAAQSLGYPYRKAAGVDATWIGEVTDAVEETTVEYGRREFKPNKMAKIIKLSRTLMQHAPMAEGVLMDEMRDLISRGAENAYMNGDGSAKPLGIFIASNSGISTGRDVATGNTATTVTFDGLIEAKYSLKQQYWGNAQWVMHRDLAKMLMKIKDGEGQYIWQNSVAAGQPDRLLNAPVNMSEFAPNTYTTGLYAAVYGDFRNYWICDASSVAVQVLRELYARTNQIGYMVDYFGDGAPVLEEAFVRVKLG